MNGIKIEEGSYFNAGIDSEGKLILWTDFWLKNETIETNIYCRDLTFFNPPFRTPTGISKTSLLLIIDNDYRLITVILDIQSKTVIQRDDFSFTKKVIKVKSLRDKSNILILLEDGSLRFIGNDKYLKLPKNDIFKLKNFVDITLTEHTATALAEDGTLFSWGIFEKSNIQIPLKYYKPREFEPKIIKMVSNKYVTIIIKEDGKIDGWGNNFNNQLNFPKILVEDSPFLVKDIILNDSVVLALIENNDVGFLETEFSKGTTSELIYWGIPNDNLDYLTGDNSDRYKYSKLIPTSVIDKMKSGIKLIKLYGGKDSISVLFEDGAIFSWGFGIHKIKTPTNVIFVPDLISKEKDDIFIDIKNQGFVSPIEMMIEKINNKEISIDSFTFEITELIEGRSFSFKNKFTNIDSNFRFNIEREIGSGTFGKVFLINSTKKIEAYGLPSIQRKTKYIVKVPISEIKGSSLNDFTEEVIKQMIIYDKTKDFSNGAICGKIVFIAFDSSSNKLFIIQEYFPKTLGSYLVEGLVSKNLERKIQHEKTFLMLVNLLCRKLSQLNSLENFEFNHRDMKSDNIMISYDGRGNPNNIFLIDFGYSCVNINGYKLGGNTSLFSKTKCFNPSRDLSFLIFSMYYNYSNFGINFSYGMSLFLRWLLSFKVKESSPETLCEPYKGCEYEITSDIQKIDIGITSISLEKIENLFNQSYIFFNKNYVMNPKTTPENLSSYISIFLDSNMDFDSFLLNPYIIKDYVSGEGMQRDFAAQSQGSSEANLIKTESLGVNLVKTPFTVVEKI
jgi:alpha-tubulin suppressor-like RCC1 family protein/serine/threonine protein kinase